MFNSALYFSFNIAQLETRAMETASVAILHIAVILWSEHQLPRQEQIVMPNTPSSGLWGIPNLCLN